MYILPYRLEYSYGSQNCKKCSKNIKSGSLKIAIMMQSDEEDIEYPDWYHQKCFFQTHLPRTEAAFNGFTNLRYADQLAIRVQLGTMEIKRKKESKVIKLPDFGIEYAKTDRDSCAGCHLKIKMSEIRIMNVVYDIDKITANDGKATWYHVVCFARSRKKLGWLISPEFLPGFKRLCEEDKVVIKKHIPVMKQKEYKPITKSITDENLNELEKQIQTQNIEYYELFDIIAKNLSKKEQVDLLTKNMQPVPDTKYKILHRLTETIYFGRLPKCDKNWCFGNLYFNNTTYSCWNWSQWGKCDNNTMQPKRCLSYIPYSLLIKYPFLQKFSGRVQTRVLHILRTIDENGEDLIHAPYKKPPLLNMEFVQIGKLKKTKEEIEKTIRHKGGKVVAGIHNKLAAIISNEKEVQKMGAKMAEAKTKNIQVVSEEFLSDLENIDPVSSIISRNIADWGGNAYTRIEQKDVKSKRETISYTKSLPDKMTYEWKNGDCDLVDPDSGLKNQAHVYYDRENNLKYSTVLVLVDIEFNRNSYYRLQLLESNDVFYKLYWIFESWGRISTVIGSKKLTPVGRRDQACEKFQNIFKDKTGYAFSKYSFGKSPRKYYKLDIDMNPPQRIPKTFVATKLNETVYNLMRLIFDTGKMENDMMVKCDLDLKQMPLGKISASQIRQAMVVLQNISSSISKNGTSAEFRNHSNQFYTLIPHGFSVNRPKIIDSVEIVKAKAEMLEGLLNMEEIHGFIKGQNGEQTNPFDAYYQKLGSEIVPLKQNSAKFKQLAKIVSSTHGQTHNEYTLEVIDIFKIKRKGEDRRFRAYKDLDNHQLLWHGSRVTNYVSILSNGLKLPPREAPNTLMFGKGIYFADMVSKSANYCYTSRYDRTGLMLMCEVALGNIRKPLFASDVQGLPNDKEQSVKGSGATFPTEFCSIDGIQTACGGVQPAKVPTGLNYNEFVVYDPAQVRMKYLFRMKFNYK